MPLFPRLLSRRHREALAAEAAGDLLAAATAFAEAGRAGEVVRVRRRLAAEAALPAPRAEHLRAALSAAKGRLDPASVLALSRELAAALLELGTPEALGEAASLAEGMGELLTAADALLALGRVEEARRVLATGRHFERLEALDRASARREAEGARVAGALSAARADLAEGRRRDALATLEVLSEDPACDDGAREAALRALQQVREARPEGRCALSLPGAARAVSVYAGLPRVLGRAEDSVLPLTEVGISRHHVRLAPHGQQWILEDLESRNGTFVEGLPVAPGFALEGSGRFTLGERCRIAWRVGAPGAVVLEVERGPAAGARAALLAGPVPLAVLLDLPDTPGTLALEAGWFVVESPEAIRLGGRALAGPARVELLAGDRLEVGMLSMEVRSR